MDPDRLARLTDKQRECLRMVNAHMSSKMIAQQLGVTPEAIDQRIKTAVRTLGVRTRYEAALVLARSEDGETYQQTIYDPPGIVRPPHPATLAPLNNEAGQHGTDIGNVIRERQVAFETYPGVAIQRFPLPLPIGDARPDDASIWLRLGWIIGIAIGIAFAFGALLAGAEALVRLVHS